MDVWENIWIFSDDQVNQEGILKDIDVDISVNHALVFSSSSKQLF